MTNLNDALQTLEKTKLHLTMLSPSLTEMPVHIVLNQPVNRACQFFDRIRYRVRGIDADAFRIMSAKECARRMPTVERFDDDHTVFELTFLPGVNPTEVICSLGEALAELYTVSQWEVYISNQIDQEDPPSVNELYVWGTPEGYLDAQPESNLSDDEVTNFFLPSRTRTE